MGLFWKGKQLCLITKEIQYILENFFFHCTTIIKPFYPLTILSTLWKNDPKCLNQSYEILLLHVGSFSHPNNPENLDPSYKMDLDFL